MKGHGLTAARSHTCLACRSSKVKCRHDTASDQECARCSRLGLKCVFVKGLRGQSNVARDRARLGPIGRALLTKTADDSDIASAADGLGAQPWIGHTALPVPISLTDAQSESSSSLSPITLDSVIQSLQKASDSTASMLGQLDCVERGARLLQIVLQQRGHLCIMRRWAQQDGAAGKLPHDQSHECDLTPDYLPLPDDAPGEQPPHEQPRMQDDPSGPLPGLVASNSAMQYARAGPRVVRVAPPTSAPAEAMAESTHDVLMLLESIAEDRSLQPPEKAAVMRSAQPHHGLMTTNACAAPALAPAVPPHSDLPSEPPMACAVPVPAVAAPPRMVPISAAMAMPFFGAAAVPMPPTVPMAGVQMLPMAVAVPSSSQQSSQRGQVRGSVAALAHYWGAAQHQH